jgi:hypothetical protein
MSGIASGDIFASEAALITPYFSLPFHTKQTYGS